MRMKTKTAEMKIEKRMRQKRLLFETKRKDFDVRKNHYYYYIEFSDYLGAHGELVKAVRRYIDDDDDIEVKSMRHRIDWPEEIHIRCDLAAWTRKACFSLICRMRCSAAQKRNKNFSNRISLREKPSGWWAEQQSPRKFHYLFFSKTRKKNSVKIATGKRNGKRILLRWVIIILIFLFQS